MSSRMGAVAAAVIGLLVFGGLQALAQITSTATCSSSYSWASNSLGQDVCLMAAYAAADCQTDNSFAITPLGEGYHYKPPNTPGDCFCTVVAYNLFSACADCQNRTYLDEGDWFINCTQVNDGTTSGWPYYVPDGTAWPAWTYSEYSGADYNPLAAENVAAQGASDSFPPVSSSSSATSATSTSSSSSSSKSSQTSTTSSSNQSQGSPTSFTNSPNGSSGTTSAASSTTQDPNAGASRSSSSSSHAGAIAGGVVGGVVGLALLAGLVFWLFRRQQQQKRLQDESLASANPFDSPQNGGWAQPPPASMQQGYPAHSIPGSPPPMQQSYPTHSMMGTPPPMSQYSGNTGQDMTGIGGGYANYGNGMQPGSNSQMAFQAGSMRMAPMSIHQDRASTVPSRDERPMSPMSSTGYTGVAEV